MLVFATNMFTAAGASITTNIVVGQANAGKYVLTLAWQDYPGTVGTSKTLVNDLDLTVTSPSGTVYYPNNCGTLDHTNNVEVIEFTAPETGSYTVNVNAYQINKTTGVGSQPFALVMRGPETAPEPSAPEFTSSASATEGVQNGNIEFTFSYLLSAGYPAPTYTITAAVSTGEYDFDGDTGYLYFRPANAGSFTFTCVASNEYGTATNTLTVTVTAQTLTPFEQWLADHDASGHTPDQVAPNGHTYWDNYIADIDPGDMFLTIKLDPASGTLTIPAASPNRIYTLIWTTDLSTDKDKWKEVSLGSGDPDAKIPIPDTTAKSFFARVRVELPSESKDWSLLERKGRSLLTQVRQAEQLGGE